jgi:sugar phosphate isomerase/epimerase
VEFAGYFDRQPAAIRAQLDALRLTSPSVHIAIETLEGDWAAQAASAKVIGHQTLIVPSVDRRKLPAAADWKALAARFNALGKKAAGDGLRIGYHNHNFEFPPLEGGARPFDILLAETDPALVDFEMDLYWISFAGADPLAYFAKYPGRFKFVHVKDGGPRPAFEMRDVGAGTIDWKAIFRHRGQAGIAHVYVEHDQPKDPLASIQASANYLKSLEF